MNAVRLTARRALPFLTPIALAAFAFVVGGCGSASSAPRSSTVVDEQPWRDMKAKMETMTPEQRAQYIREHPDEVANLGRIAVPTPPRPTP